MATAFPVALDTFVNPSATDDMGDPLLLHSDQHANINDAVAAIEAKLGIDGSADATSIEARIATIVASVAAISAGGGGATTIAALTDKATIDLPSVNAPLATALAAKATLQAGALAPSTTSAPNATAVQNAIAALVASAPGVLDTLNELATALANDPNFATTMTTALAGKHPTLVSGTNIKTVNGTSLLGPGDVPVIGGASAGTIVAFTTALPFDTIGAGKKFASQPLSAATTFTLAAGAVEEGNLSFCLEGDGNAAHVPTFSPPFIVDGTFDTALGQQNVYVGIFQFGTPLLFRRAGALIVPVPGQVTALAAGSAGATAMPMTWAAPSSGGPPTDYLVEYKAAASPTWLTFAHAVSTALAATVTGLVASTAYNFRVTAVGVSGNGIASATLNASTIAAPVGTAFADTFDRADGALGVASDGGTWTLSYIGAHVAGAWAIASNKLATSGESGVDWFLTRDGGTPDGTFKVKTSGVEGDDPCVVIRMVDTANCYLLRHEISGLVTVYRFVAGVLTTPHGASTVVATHGTEVSWTIVCLETSIDISYTSDMQLTPAALATITDTDFATTGKKFGVRYKGASATPRWNDVTFTP